MPNLISVMVVDDDPVSSAQLVRSRKRPDTRSGAPQRQGGVELLQLARVPIVISDWYMPEMDGPELCRRIRARTREPYVYFILVTSRGGKQQYLAGMEAGRTTSSPSRWTRMSCAPGSRSRSASSASAKKSSSSRCCFHLLVLQRIRNDHEEWEPSRSTSRSTSNSCSARYLPDCYTKYVQPQLDRGKLS